LPYIRTRLPRWGRFALTARRALATPDAHTEGARTGSVEADPRQARSVPDGARPAAISNQENGTVKKPVFVIGAAALGALSLVGLLWAQPQPARPTTRIALVNMTLILKSYKKCAYFRQELETKFKLYQDQAKGINLSIETLKKEIAAGNLPADVLDAKQKQMVKLQRDMEDKNNEAKTVLGKQQDDETVQIFKEIQEAAGKFAVARGYDMVLTFND